MTHVRNGLTNEVYGWRSDVLAMGLSRLSWHVVLHGLCEADSYLSNASALVSLRAVMHDCITATWQERAAAVVV